MVKKCFKMLGSLFDTSSDTFYIVSGILVNIRYAVIATVFGLFFGGLLATAKLANLAKYKKRHIYEYWAWSIAKIFANVYTSFFRGTPVMIQLTIIYFTLPTLLGIKFSIFAAGVTTFSLNSAAYVSEIIRSGVQAIDNDQREAGVALGLSDSMVMQGVVLPQAVRNIFPAIINEMISLIKETVVVSMIGEADVLRRGQLVATKHFDFFGPIMTVGLTYYIVILVLTLIANVIERKFCAKNNG